MDPESKPSAVMEFIRKVMRNLLARSSPMLDLVLFSLLTLGLTAAGFTYQDIYSTRQLASSYRRTCGVYVDKKIVTEGVKLLKQVRTDKEVWEYMKKQLGPNLIYRKQYNGEPIRKENQGMIMGAHRVVQQFYLRQVRVKPGSCQSGGLRQNGNISLDVPERSITYQRTGLDSMTCYPRYSVWNEDISTWQNETYVASSTRKVMDRLTTANPYRNGGFIKRIPTHDIDLFLEAIGKLENSSWTDLGTRALFFEGVTYIPAVDQFLVLSILFNYGTHGTVIPQLFVTPFRNQLKKASGSDGSSNGPELLLYFIAFCNLLREFGKMKAFGTQYFKILWNVVTIVSICFVFVSVYYRYLINRQWVEIEALDTQPWRLNSEIQQWDLDWDWASIAYFYVQLIKYQALALVMSWLRTFGYVRMFSRRIESFVASVSIAQGPISNFSLLLIFILVGCSIGFFTGYGVVDDQFRTMGSSMISLLEIMFGNYNPKVLNLANGVMISSMIVLTFALVSITSLSVALAMLSWANKQVALGLIELDHDDSAELKEALSSWARWFLTPCYYCCGITKQRLVKVKPVLQAPPEKSNAEAEAERLIIEQESWIHRAKTGLKTMIRAAAVLRSRIRTLEGEYQVSMEMTEPEFKRNNVWRKLRNNFQEEVFQDLLNLVRVGKTAAVKETLSSWKGQDWGCDMEWRDADGFTALHIAAFGGDADTVQALVHFKADVNAQNDDGNTPLHLAAMTGQLNACRILVEEGRCIVNAVNMYSFTPIHLAAYTGNLEVLKAMVDEADGDIYAQNDDGLTCLHCAVMQTNTTLVRYIAQRWPAILEVQANGGETALHAAIATRQPLDLIKVLLQCGARVGTKNYDGANAHQIAEEYSAPVAVQRLLYFVLRANDDYNRAAPTLDEGATTLALIQFAATGRIHDMQKLLAAGCNVDAVQPGGGTALHAAVRKKKGDVMEALLAAGADPMVEDTQGRTPLMFAIDSGQYDEYKLLISKVDPAEVAVPDADGNTILHYASMTGKSLRIVRDMVMNFRIDPLTVNYSGQSSVDFAHMARTRVAEVLEAGMMSGSDARGAMDLIDKIIAFFDDRDAYEDDEMMFKNEAQGKAKEEEKEFDAPVNLEAHNESNLYSMKIRKFFENVGFKTYAKEYAMLFKENEIDFDGLGMVTDEQLKEMGIMVIGTRNKILAGIKRVLERNKKTGVGAGMSSAASFADGRGSISGSMGKLAGIAQSFRDTFTGARPGSKGSNRPGSQGGT